MNETFVTISGHVCADPETRTGSTSGRKFTIFRVASTPRRQVNGQYLDGPTSFYSVVAFGRLGAHLLKSFKKGDAVIVQGRLRVRQWANEGKTGTSVEVDAYLAGHDLNRGITTLQRGTFSWPGEERTDQPDVAEALVAQDAEGLPDAVGGSEDGRDECDDVIDPGVPPELHLSRAS